MTMGHLLTSSTPIPTVAENERAEAERRAKELREANIKIQDQLLLTTLNQAQVVSLSRN